MGAFKDYLKSEKGFTYVFHASPENNLYKMRPSGRKGQSLERGEAGLFVAPSFSDAVKWAVSFVAHKKKSGKPFQQITIYKLKVPKKLLVNAWKHSWWEKEYFIPESEMDQIEIVQFKTYPYTKLIEISNKEEHIKFAHRRNRTRPENLPNNYAAQEYLRLRSDIADYAMKKKSKYNINFNKLEELLASLKKYFTSGLWQDEPKETLSSEEIFEVKKIVARIESILR
jgi:hypothetical protein